MVSSFPYDLVAFVVVFVFLFMFFAMVRQRGGFVFFCTGGGGTCFVFGRNSLHRKFFFFSVLRTATTNWEVIPLGS